MKIRKLSSGSARARREAGEYLGDGVKLLEEALRWKAPLTTEMCIRDSLQSAVQLVYHGLLRLGQGDTVPQLGVYLVALAALVLQQCAPLSLGQIL